MLLDHYSPTAYATLKVDHYFTPGQVSPIIFAQLNTPSRSLSRSVKAHTKLPVVAAYLYLGPYLHFCCSSLPDTDMQ